MSQIIRLKGLTYDLWWWVICIMQVNGSSWKESSMVTMFAGYQNHCIRNADVRILKWQLTIKHQACFVWALYTHTHARTPTYTHKHSVQTRYNRSFRYIHMYFQNDIWTRHTLQSIDTLYQTLSCRYYKDNVCVCDIQMKSTTSTYGLFWHYFTIFQIVQPSSA